MDSILTGKIEQPRFADDEVCFVMVRLDDPTARSHKRENHNLDKGKGKEIVMHTGKVMCSLNVPHCIREDTSMANSQTPVLRASVT